MEKQVKFSNTFNIAAFVLIGVGLIAFVVAFLTAPEKAWSNLLINNYIFLSLAIGGTFFLAIQYITQSGWSAAFKRIPEAMGNYIPFAAVFMILILFGLHSLYHWTHEEAVAHDPILQHKEPYLNIPFFIVRLVIYFAAWILLTRLIRRASLREDKEGGMKYFIKTEWYSKIYIFTLAITFSLASFDWIMSIDPHWYSTIFALKNFVSAFFHASALITLIVILLNRAGYFPFLNNAHWADFSKYIFILSIIWGYFWFSQYLLIWYANIPEETMYYYVRLQGEWSYVFHANMVLNWAIPFVVLLSNYFARRKNVLLFVVICTMIGHWVDMYLQVTPGAIGGEVSIGFIEIGAYLGFLGLFAVIFARSLRSAPLIPENHPFIEESLYHHEHAAK